MFFLFIFIYLFIFSGYQTISFVWIVSHLVFYITFGFASNVQRLLVVYMNCNDFRFPWPLSLSVRNIGKPQVAFLFSVLLFMSIFPFITRNLSYLQSQTLNIQKICKTTRGTQRLFSVKYLFGEAKYCLEFSFAWGRQKDFKMNIPFMCNFRSLSNKFPTIFWSLSCHTLLPRLHYFSLKRKPKIFGF